MGYVNLIRKVVSTPITTGDYMVRTIDPLLGVVNTQYVDRGQNGVSYTHPEHDYLTADGYNNSYDNIQHDMDIGLQYKTTDGKTYLFLSITNITGKKPTIYLNKADTSLMTVTWGDGETTTGSASGSVALAKPNDYGVGDYICTIECAGNYRLAPNTAIANFFNGAADYDNVCTRVYVGDNVIGLDARGFNSLEYVILPTTMPAISEIVFYLCEHIKYIIVPSQITNLNTCYFAYGGKRLKYLITPDTYNIFHGGLDMIDYNYCIESFIMAENAVKLVGMWPQNIRNCYALEKFIVAKKITSINQLNFQTNYVLKELTFYEYLTTIGASCFTNMYAMRKYVWLATVPPSLAAGCFVNINKICKHYVPDDQITDYQGATNWVTFANYFYPLSELSEYDGSIFFHSNGGSVVEHIQGEVGEVATEPTAPTKAGFTFDGWYKDAGLTTAWNWATDVYPDTNLTLYAKWI